MRLRRRKVVGERGRDLADRAEVLACGLEVVVGAGGVAVGGGKQGGGGADRELPGGHGQLDGVLLVALAARVGERAQEPLRLGVLGARLAVEHLAHRAGEAPGPAREDLVGRVGLALADRAQQHPDALDAVLLPRRRLRDEGDEVVEAHPVDRRRHPVGERHQPQPPVRVLGGAGEEELVERRLAGAGAELLDQRHAVVEAGLAAGDPCPEALLFLVEIARVDALPFALDHGEAPVDVRRDRYEPRRGRQATARPPLHPAARRRRDAGALAVEVGAEQGVERDHAVRMSRALLDEVDHDSGLLARVKAHDAADPLLVDAPAGGRGEVHDHGRAR